MKKIKNISMSPVKLIRSQSQTYWRNLSLKSYAKFLFAIFLIFGCIGYLRDIMSGGQFTAQLAKDLHDILVPTIKFKNSDYEVYAQAIPSDEVGDSFERLFTGHKERHYTGTTLQPG